MVFSSSCVRGFKRYADVTTDRFQSCITSDIFYLQETFDWPKSLNGRLFEVLHEPDPVHRISLALIHGNHLFLGPSLVLKTKLLC